MNLVLDSCAIIAYLHNEPGADVVDALMLDRGNVCFVHAINLCEVYYEARRRGGEERAQATLAVLRRAGLVIREDMDDDLWQQAGASKPTTAASPWPIASAPRWRTGSGLSV